MLQKQRDICKEKSEIYFTEFIKIHSKQALDLTANGRTIKLAEENQNETVITENSENNTSKVGLKEEKENNENKENEELFNRTIKISIPFFIK